MLTALLQRTFRPSQDTTERNIRYLYLEIAFASILASIVSFNSAFAIRLGASNEVVALLTSGPALVAAIFSIPSARFLQSRSNHKPWIFNALLLMRLGYLLVPLLPLLIADQKVAATWFVIWIVLLNIPAIFFTNGFQAMLADVIPEKRRSFVFSRRSIILAIGVAIMSMVVGYFLEAQKGIFPLNYQVMYVFGVLTVLGSSYYLNKISVPNPAHRPTRRNLRVQDVQALTEDKPIRLSPPIRRMLMNMAVYQIGLTIAASLFNVYYINHLKATDEWLGVNSAVANIGVIIGYVMWERLLRRHSFGWGIRTATLFTWIFPVSVGLFPNLNIILFTNFFVNIMHPGVDLSSMNTMLNLAEPAERAVIMSWYNSMLNVMAFLCPLIGAWLAGFISIDIPGVMFIAGAFRILGSLLFRYNRVETEDAAEASVTAKA
ncbi:MAG: MFS transporter [Anaerolineae bacterium]|nr:MFS transporter [Anaerolineae bacterium]